MSSIQVTRVKQLIEELKKFPEDAVLYDNCVDENGKWYIYPVRIGKAWGDDKLPVIELSPVKDESKVTKADS